MSVNRFLFICLKPEANYNLKLIGPMCRNVCLRARVHAVVVVVDTMLGAWPKMPTSTFSQSRGRI